MRKSGVLVLLLLVAGALAWVAWPNGVSPSLGPVDESRHEEPRPAAPLRGSSTDEAPREVTRDVIAPASEGQTSAPVELPRTLLVGRCVAAQGGHPIARARVSAARPARQVVTGDDGRFVLVLTDVHPPPYYAVRIDARGCISLENHLFIATGKTEDTGDVPMHGSVRVHGRVLDPEGVPVDSAGLTFVNPQNRRTGPGWSRHGHVTCTAGRDGSYEVDLSPGRHLIGVRVHALELPKAVDVAGTVGWEPLDIVVTRRQPTELICGQVVDPDGQPVPNVQINLLAPASAEARAKGIARLPVEHVVADQTGHFEVIFKAHWSAGEKDAKEGMWLAVKPSETLVAAPRLLPWGTLDARIELLRRDGLPVDVVLRVVVAGTDERVEAWSAAYQEVQGAEGNPNPGVTHFHAGTLSEAARHRDGEFEVRGLGDGRFAVAIRPGDQENLLDARCTLDLPRDRGRTVVVELTRKVPLTVRLQDDGGEPVRGSRVTAMRRTEGQWMYFDHKVSDAQGIARLRVPEGIEVHVGVHGNHAPVSREGVRARAEPVLIVIERGATVELQVRPAEVWQELRPTAAMRETWKGKPDAIEPRLQLVEVDRKFSLPQVPAASDNVAEGRFAIAGVVAGRYRVQVHYFSSATVQHAFLLPDVHEVKGGGGRLAVDVSAMRLGALRGRVFVDGELAREQDLSVSGRADSGSYFSTRARTDGEGSYAVERLMPGKYQVNVIGRDVVLDTPVAPGAQLVRDIEVFVLSLELVVVDAGGTPAANRRFETSAGPLVADERGVLRWSPAPPQPVFVDVDKDGKKERLGPFAMRKGERVTRIEVRL